MPYLQVLNDATNYLFEYFSNKKLTKSNKIVDKKVHFQNMVIKKVEITFILPCRCNETYQLIKLTFC